MKKNTTLISKIAFLLFFMFASCDKKNNDTISFIEKFPINENLKSVAHSVSKDLLLPTEMFISNSKLVIYDGGKTELFKVFSLPDLEYKYSWGNIGKGPNEFRMVDPNTFDLSSNGVYVKDIHSIKHIEIKNDSVVFQKETKLPLLENIINRIRKINDSIYFADNALSKDDFEHVIINTNKKRIVSQFGKYPDDGLKFDKPNDNYQFYGKDNVINISKQKFATFYYFSNKFKLFDLEGNLLNEVNIKSKKENKNLRSKIVYNIKPHATKNYIYALHSGELTKKDMMSNFSEVKLKLNIWDWNGKPIASYSLDRPISDFVVDETNNMIYATSFIDINNIYTIALPKNKPH